MGRREIEEQKDSTKATLVVRRSNHPIRSQLWQPALACSPSKEFCGQAPRQLLLVLPPLLRKGFFRPNEYNWIVCTRLSNEGRSRRRLRPVYEALGIENENAKLAEEVKVTFSTLVTTDDRPQEGFGDSCSYENDSRDICTTFRCPPGCTCVEMSPAV